MHCYATQVNNIHAVCTQYNSYGYVTVVCKSVVLIFNKSQLCFTGRWGFNWHLDYFWILLWSTWNRWMVTGWWNRCCLHYNRSWIYITTWKNHFSNKVATTTAATNDNHNNNGSNNGKNYPVISFTQYSNHDIIFAYQAHTAMQHLTLPSVSQHAWPSPHL